MNKWTMDLFKGWNKNVERLDAIIRKHEEKVKKIVNKQKELK